VRVLPGRESTFSSLVGDASLISRIPLISKQGLLCLEPNIEFVT
jgi:hypothetical protein